MTVRNLPPNQIFIAQAGHIPRKLHIYYPAGANGTVDVSVNQGDPVQFQMTPGHTETIDVLGQWIAVGNNCPRMVQLLYTSAGEIADADGHEISHDKTMKECAG